MRILYVNRKLSVFERFDCTGNGELHSFLLLKTFCRRAMADARR